MARSIKTLLPVLLLTILAAGQVRVSSGVSSSNLLEKVEPVYPEIAKAARIQGSVVLAVDIDAKGSVTDVHVISGHPMLLTAATDAVKQWTYRPFKLNGEPVSVKTEVTVNFSLGISGPESQKEQETSQAYFVEDKQCRAALSGVHYSDAQSVCGEEVKISEQLSAARGMERVSAYSLLGQAYFYDKKFPEALSSFQRELETAQKYLHDDDAELAYAYRHFAWGLHSNGRSDEALTAYQHAENSLEAAEAHIGSEFLKNEYAKTLKATFKDHAILLRQMRKDSQADEMEKKSDAIAIKTGLTNPY